MSILVSATLDYAKAEQELDEFKAWLDANGDFGERAVVEELKKRRDLCLLIGPAAGRGQPDLYKHEFGIQGAFAADLVVGCSSTRHFVLVEFEGGSKSSVFNQRKGTAQLRDWGSELQHAFSQVSDWTWAKNDAQKSDIYRNAFGVPVKSETYLVVCGRDGHLGQTERSRLEWRSEKTAIAGCSIRFWTYDDLWAQASAQLDAYWALKADQAVAQA